MIVCYYGYMSDTLIFIKNYINKNVQINNYHISRKNDRPILEAWALVTDMHEVQLERPNVNASIVFNRKNDPSKHVS